MPRRLARFEDADGLTLKGVVFEPDTGVDRCAEGLIYLPGIVMGATAVHGLGLKVAERLAKAGFVTSIFDPPGVGESEGDYPAGTHEELSEWVSEGNLIRSTLEVDGWMGRELGIERVGLIGHCGGALTASYCVPADEAIVGALLISPPPLKREKGKSEVAREEVADEYFRLYARKVTDMKRWKRLFSGESDYRTLATVVRTKAGGFIRAKFGRKASGTPEGSVDDGRFNPRLVEATRRSLEQDKRLTVVFGDRDVDMKNFRDFYEIHMDPRVPLEIIEDTSHGFTTAAGQARLIEGVRRFAEGLR